jgi:hypothetical protein
MPPPFPAGHRWGLAGATALRSLSRLALRPEATARPSRAMPQNHKRPKQMPGDRGHTFSLAVPQPGIRRRLVASRQSAGRAHSGKTRRRGRGELKSVGVENAFPALEICRITEVAETQAKKPRPRARGYAAAGDTQAQRTTSTPGPRRAAHRMQEPETEGSRPRVRKRARLAMGIGDKPSARRLGPSTGVSTGPSAPKMAPSVEVLET